jgi:hypothetical protein
MIKFLPLLIFAFFTSPLAANQLSSQALSINVGPVDQYFSDTEGVESRDTAFQISYGAPLYKQLLYSFSYYDEGDESNCERHELCHKRDGFSFQLWGALPVTKRLNVRFGIGPYLCFDTVLSTTQDFQQTRSIVPMYSLATSYDFKLFGHPSFAQLTINKTGTRDGFATTSYLLGLGAYFAPAEKYNKTTDTIPAGKVTFLAGLSIENGDEDRLGPAFSLEYSRRILQHLDWSVAILRENGPKEDLDRTGLVAQLWLKTQLTKRFNIGLGAGPAHFSGETATAGVISASAGYNLSNEWELSFRINRVSTGSELETDNVLFGISRGL